MDLRRAHGIDHHGIQPHSRAAGLPKFSVYDCRVQAITKLLSNPAVHPQVSKEIAGHISQAMQDRYSIQQHDTKMAALEALERPRRTEPEPTPPAQQPASATLIHCSIQEEMYRQVDQKVALALQKYFASRPSAEVQGRRARTKKNRSASVSKKEEALFLRQENPTKVIAFPTRSA